MKIFAVDMTSEGKGALAALLSLLWEQQGYNGNNFRTGEKRGAKFIAMRDPGHVLDFKAHRLIFFWSKSPTATDIQELPITLDAEGASYLANNWLETAEYGPEPDTDGHCNKGWRVYNEAWGHVDDDPYAFLAIEPAWIEYGK